MAARLNKRHQDFVKDKIQASQLINRLQNHVDGKIELSASQVQAAKILLDKVISNAPAESTVNLSANVDVKHERSTQTTDWINSIVAVSVPSDEIHH